MAAAISCIRALPASWLRIQPRAQKPYTTAARPQTSARISAELPVMKFLLSFRLSLREGANAAVPPLRCFLVAPAVGDDWPTGQIYRQSRDGLKAAPGLRRPPHTTQ